MKTMKHYLGIGLVLILVAPVGVQALLLPGSEQTFGDFAGATVLYSNVYEHTDSGTYGIPATYGTDKLDFNPQGIKSEASAETSHINDARVSFHIIANEGKYIQGLDFTESGDFSFVGAVDSDWQTYVGVAATFNIDIYEVDGLPATIPNVQLSIDNFNPEADGFFDLNTYGPSLATSWDGSIYIDFNQILIDMGYSFESGVTHAYVALNNVLATASGVGDYSSIQKKDADGFSVTADVIPEPASLVLIMGTTSLFMLIRRRFIG